MARLKNRTGAETKELILTHAFKLFATNTYEQVTFTELESSLNITRGAIMYHFKTKELIFQAMCDKFLLIESSILTCLKKYTTPEITLKDFISIYVKAIMEIKRKTASFGIKNFNKALINITNQATYYYPSFEVKALRWQIMQIELWKNILNESKIKSEIRPDIDIDTLADLFEDIYCGISYSGIIFPDGIDVKRLEDAFNFVYKTIKAE